MALTALIVFGQDTSSAHGRALEGLVGAPVVVANDNNAEVAEWRISLVDVPPDSAVPIGLLAQDDNNTPHASFVPDRPGSYRVMLEVVSRSGARDVDIRNFGIRNARGIIVPPYQGVPEPLPILGSGRPGEKPDEQNYGGQGRGWAGTRASGMLEQFFYTYEDLPPTALRSTVTNISANDATPLYSADLDALGGGAVVNLPLGARVGQLFRFLVARSVNVTRRLTLNPPTGHTINARNTVAIAPGSSTVAAFLGGATWAMLGAREQQAQRTLVGAVGSTDQLGFTAVGARILNPDDFVNLRSVTWSAILETTNALAAAEIRLFNVTTSSAVAGSTLSASSLIPSGVSAAIELSPGANLYEIQLRLQSVGSPERAICKSAQVRFDWLEP